MSSRKQPIVRKPSKKIADPRRVRFGAGVRAGPAALGSPPATEEVAHAMLQTLQPSPTVTFYGAVPGCRAPMRADPSVLGTLPSRGFQYCEALRAASSFGWYVFPPIDFTLQWDGSQIIWTYRGAKAWYPLTSAQFPGYQSTFDRAAPKRLRGFAPPFLTAVPEPGIVQLWTGLMMEQCRRLEHPGPAAGEPSARLDLRPVRRRGRDRPLVRPAVHQPASDQDRRADPFQHRDAAGAGAAAAPKHLCG